MFIFHLLGGHTFESYLPDVKPAAQQKLLLHVAYTLMRACAYHAADAGVHMHSIILRKTRNLVIGSSIIPNLTSNNQTDSVLDKTTTAP